MPVPQPPAQLSVEHQAELLADEAWQVCGLRAASLADAAPIIGLLQGRYRPVPGSALAVLRDSAGALVADADAGIEFVEQQHYFRTTEDGVVVLELTQQRQSRIDRVIANFRLIQLDPAVLIRAVERRFGRRDSIGVGEPLISGGRALDVASFGRYAPQEPDSRRLLMLLGGETISMHCFLREFQQRGSP
ncbi:MAG: hypothetical protein A4S17_02365 [Proteobacteria bacterium HN_bin10]|nr:MAG: hypothetical protein A4S17_02365 [Proteobacteria bacterium HN_bin10]